MPASIAIALAVSMLSPVTILTLMPAVWHFLTEEGTDILIGSLIPKIPTKVRDDSRTSLSFSEWNWLLLDFRLSNSFNVKSV